jgi:hypothetical protein
MHFTYTPDQFGQLPPNLEFCTLDPNHPRMELNEGKACEAILLHLESREGAARADLCWPDKEHHAAPVDLVCSIGGQLYAIEHTGIEPFSGLLQLNNQADHYFGPIIAAIEPVIPSDEVYELRLPLMAMQGKKGREVRQIQKALGLLLAGETSPPEEKAGWRTPAAYPR